MSGALDAKTIVVLEGDETGQELLEESLRVLAPEVTGLDLEFPRFDLSLESRRASQNQVVHEAAQAIREHGFGLKGATITPEERDGVGSPNRILREEIGGKVIVRTGRRIPGVAPFGGVHAPISIVRMAVGDAYGAKEWREGEGDDEVAFRTERIERRICRAVAEFSFRQAEQAGAKVFGGPKYTVSPTYEGMLKEEMDAAAERHPAVPYEPQLIDATFALLISSAGDPLVIPALNRDGDILSDLVLPLFGSIAGSESMLVAFEDDYEPRALMAEAAHGTAPSLRGKNVANPMAMILAGAALLSYGDDRARAGRSGDPRVLSRGGRPGVPDSRSRRTRRHERVHRRGDQADALEARSLGDPLGLYEAAAVASSAPALQAVEERVRHRRVELRAGAALHLLDRRGDRKRTSIRSHRGHGVERIGDCEQARLFGNVLAGATGGIPAAVPALVVVQHVGQRFLSGPDGPDQPRARSGMLPDLRDLVGLERTALVEDRLRDHHLAEVVQRTAERQRPEPVIVPAHPHGDTRGEQGHAGAVRRRRGVTRGERCGECGRASA